MKNCFNAPIMSSSSNRYVDRAAQTSHSSVGDKQVSAYIPVISSYHLLSACSQTTSANTSVTNKRDKETSEAARHKEKSNPPIQVGMYFTHTPTSR